MRVANAPCSWGVLEFESTARAPARDQVLDEIAATGYEGTELGDWGFLGTDPARLQSDLNRRRLALAGAFVAVPLTDRSAHDASENAAVRTARLLAGAGGGLAVIVLSDATAAVPERTARAGRITTTDGLSAAAWDAVAAGADRIAAAVRTATGLRTVFHHHCATYVETPDEIDALMATPHMAAAIQARFSPATAAASVTSTSKTVHVRWPPRRGAKGGTTCAPCGTACSASWGRDRSISALF